MTTLETVARIVGGVLGMVLSSLTGSLFLSLGVNAIAHEFNLPEFSWWVFFALSIGFRFWNPFYKGELRK